MKGAKQRINEGEIKAWSQLVMTVYPFSQTRLGFVELKKEARSGFSGFLGVKPAKT